MCPRAYRQPHESYVIEWLGLNYPPGSWRTNVRLGKIIREGAGPMTEDERRYVLGGFGASADGIVNLDGVVTIVEAKVRQDPGKLEKLKRYERLYGQTEDERAHWGEPIKLILLTPTYEAQTEQQAKEWGIEVRYYTPLWIQEYLASYPRYERRGELGALEI